MSQRLHPAIMGLLKLYIEGEVKGEVSDGSLHRIGVSWSGRRGPQRPTSQEPCVSNRYPSFLTMASHVPDKPIPRQYVIWNVSKWLIIIFLTLFSKRK